MSKKVFYITTPIYYTNSTPHIGGAYTTLACDVMARFKKLDGYDVKFLTGTDEHGQKIAESAEKNGKSPQEFVNEMSQHFRDLVKTMNCAPSHFEAINDNFIRTTNDFHKKNVQEMWKLLEKNGWIYLDKYSGWYCVGDEAYYTEDELIKDEEGNFKTSLGKAVEWKEEESYFFALGDFQKILLDLYKEKPDFVQPNYRKNEVIAFVSGLNIKDFENNKDYIKGHLKDLSISRNSFDWGIQVPEDTN